MKTYIGLIFILIGTAGMAQTPPLEDHTWYLEKLIINGNTTYTPQGYVVTSYFCDSSNSQQFCGGLDFRYDSCADFYGLVSYANNQNFSFNNGGSAGMQICLNPLDPFDELYIWEFIQFDTYVNPYSYSFTNQANNLIILTITNANGDQAIYQSQPLAIMDNAKKTGLSLYPNPANAYFTLKPKNMGVEKLVVYSLSGKEVKTFEARDNYSVTDLASGIYIVKIIAIDQQQSIIKLVKE